MSTKHMDIYTDILKPKTPAGAYRKNKAFSMIRLSIVIQNRLQF